MLCESAIYFMLPVICGVAIAISYQCLRQHTISETRIQQGLQAILCGRYGFRQRRLQVADVNARVRPASATAICASSKKVCFQPAAIDTGSFRSILWQHRSHGST